MIKKIKNLKLENTENTNNLELAEIRGFKNRLLQQTNWTQLADNNLTPRSLKEFTRWRNLVKLIDVDKIENKLTAKHELNKLEKIKPIPVFMNEEDEKFDIDKTKNDLLEKLYINNTRYKEKFYLKYGGKDIFLQKIEESKNYKIKKFPPNFNFRYPYIINESNIRHKIIDEIVDEYLDLLSASLAFELKCDSKYMKWVDAIESCTTISECDTISEEIVSFYGY